MVSKKVLAITVVAIIALLGGALGVAWAQGPVAPDGDYGKGRGGAGFALCEVLGMTPQELRAELRAGKTLAEVMDERGVSPEAVAEARAAQYAQWLASMVEKGWVTQEQADELAATMQKQRMWLGEREGAGRGLQGLSDKFGGRIFEKFQRRGRAEK